MLEAICDRKPWIWNDSFEMPGSLYDINVMEASSLMENMGLDLFSPPCQCPISGGRQNKPYSFPDLIISGELYIISTFVERTTKK